MHIIIRNKPQVYGKTRSQHEENLRKEWGPTLTDEQFDKLKYLEKKIKEKTGSINNLITADILDKVK